MSLSHCCYFEALLHGHVQQYFSDHFNIKGFNVSNAKDFAFKILNDKQMVDNILNFNPSDFEESFSMFECEI